MTTLHVQTCLTPWVQDTDAAVWAREFMRIFGGERRGEIDEGLMVGWFANSIMVGYDWGRRDGGD